MSENKPKIGLALSSGGARGFAHVGVIKSLVKHNIPIDIITGVSAGALFGGIYASGATVEEIEEVCYSTTNYKEILPIVWDFSRKTSGGFIIGKKVDKFLNSLLKEKNIENFPIKFICTATDLISGRAVYFDKGSASIAIRASGAIPGIFKPIEYNGKYLVDGGVVEPISLECVKKLGGNVNIGVDISRSPNIPEKVRNGKKLNIKDSLYSSFALMQKRFTDIEFKENKDFLRIRPKVDWIKSLEFYSSKTARKGIKEGERIMDKNILKVKEMIKNYQKK
ncbi:MAG: patatin-like phospholipase family protein [Candidatus Hodarchaeales archaeon]